MTIGKEPILWTGPRLIALAGLLAVQFALATAIGTGHWLANDAQSFFAPIALTAVIPVTVFLAAYTVLPRFREFVLAQDLRLLTSFHIWRMIGFTFLALYAVDALPGLFAWPAGLGDMAIGIAALFVVIRLNRDPDFATSTGYVRFHLLGLLDFAGAIVTAGLTSGAIPALVANGITSAPMDVWPLNIFPSFIVPSLIILHLAALLKVRSLRRAAQAPADAVLGTA